LNRDKKSPEYHCYFGLFNSERERQQRFCRSVSF